ncbi:TrmH family RNA methyltransferase [Ammoniphilus resinae]|uniref:TrmH family RNA methyltransferase n=1 Tax=Ammoniphilus resinae TaxID=861532 RepID=A0ABS4GJA1_9BACL|nr:RNA methyltransferase [Ammoniphilus resinae]MBP1930338.1 TrmH family RNA methyltransferase [Ammoniphilus resinae]
MEFIQSIQNSKVKQWAKLISKKGREQEHAFLVEGEHLVEEAMKAEELIQCLIIQETMQEKYQGWIDECRAPSYLVSEQVMNKLSETQTPQGICAVVQINKHSLSELTEGRPILLALDGLQDPGNLGTIIRTADAAGIDGVILGKGTVDLYNGKVIRSTMGSIFHLPIFQLDLTVEIPRLKEKGFRIVSTSLEGAVAYDEPQYADAVVIVIGNEANGVSQEILQCSTTKVKIPLYGQAESLNAAVAAGIILYEAARQRRKLQG